MSSNHEFSEGLWLGGGIRWETLGQVSAAIEFSLSMNDDIPAPVVAEMTNLANAARAELQKRPPPPPTWSKYL